MRTRMLKPEFFGDEDLGNIDPLLRIYYAGLWCAADKEGRLEDRPVSLKKKILPYDDIADEWPLIELAKPKAVNKNRQPFILRYEVNGEKYIQILQFRKHQFPHHTEKNSKIPPPPGNVPDNIEPSMSEMLKKLTNKA
jgi:hypothetical protein